MFTLHSLRPRSLALDDEVSFERSLATQKIAFLAWRVKFHANSHLHNLMLLWILSIFSLSDCLSDQTFLLSGESKHVDQFQRGEKVALSDDHQRRGEYLCTFGLSSVVTSGAFAVDICSASEGC